MSPGSWSHIQPNPHTQAQTHTPHLRKSTRHLVRVGIEKVCGVPARSTGARGTRLRNGRRIVGRWHCGAGAACGGAHRVQNPKATIIFTWGRKSDVTLFCVVHSIQKRKRFLRGENFLLRLSAVKHKSKNRWYSGRTGP